jgi:hypothetical protein
VSLKNRRSLPSAASLLSQLPMSLCRQDRERAPPPPSNWINPSELLRGQNQACLATVSDVLTVLNSDCHEAGKRIRRRAEELITHGGRDAMACPSDILCTFTSRDRGSHLSRDPCSVGSLLAPAPPPASCLALVTYQRKDGLTVQACTLTRAHL